MALWKSQEAASATQGEAKGSWEAKRVVIDSRAVQPGDLFVALKGERFDGHDYIQTALEKGAVAALASHAPAGVDVTRLLQVADTMQALEALARKARQRTQAKIAGITGSVGKTSAKEALTLALSALGKVHATQGNYNNHIGVPLTLANLPHDAQFAVIEMGMNHAGEIATLTRQAKPHVAMITAVEAVHIEFFDSVAGIAAAKAEICAGIVPGGAVILPAYSPYLGLMQRLARDTYGIEHILTFGAQDYADYRLVSCNIEELGMVIEAHIGNTPMQYRLGAMGDHWATLSVGVLGMVDLLREDVRASAEALQRFREPEGRGNIQRITLQDDTEAYLIDDSYNASPASMRAAFAKLVGVHRGLAPEGRKIAILGDMLELGLQAPEYHQELAKDLESAGVHQVFVAGELMKHLWFALPPAMHGAMAPSAQALLPLVKNALCEGDTVLVKGSHGSQIYTLAKALKEAAPKHEE